MSDLITRLQQAGAQGADLSPGDPLCFAAAVEIERLERELALRVDYASRVREQALESGRLETGNTARYEMVVRRFKKEVARLNFFIKHGTHISFSTMRNGQSMVWDMRDGLQKAGEGDSPREAIDAAIENWKEEDPK